MLSKNIITIIQPTKLTKQSKNTKVKLCNEWKPSSYEEDHRGGGCLMKMEETFKMDLEIVVKQLFFLWSEGNTC